MVYYIEGKVIGIKEDMSCTIRYKLATHIYADNVEELKNDLEVEFNDKGYLDLDKKGFKFNIIQFHISEKDVKNRRFFLQGSKRNDEDKLHLTIGELK